MMFDLKFASLCVVVLVGLVGGKQTPDYVLPTVMGRYDHDNHQYTQFTGGTLMDINGDGLCDYTYSSEIYDGKVTTNDNMVLFFFEEGELKKIERLILFFFSFFFFSGLFEYWFRLASCEWEWWII